MHFQDFCSVRIDDRLALMRENGVYGDNLEIQALSEMFNRTVEIYARDVQPINILQARDANREPPIRLLYVNGNHYDSIVDEARPAVGVGLGMAGYNPQGSVEQAIANRVAEETDRERTEAEMAQMVVDQEMDEAILEQAISESARDAEFVDLVKAICASYPLK